jgi:hypothetical protein
MNAVQFFIGMHNEMFSVVAMCVSNKDHLPSRTAGAATQS